MLTYTAVRLYNLIIVTNGADEVVITYCLLSYYSYLLYVIKGLYLAEYKVISHFQHIIYFPHYPYNSFYCLTERTSLDNMHMNFYVTISGSDCTTKFMNGLVVILLSSA